MSSQAVGQETNTSADGDVPVLKLSWDAPTTRVNGSPLAADEIGGYDLECTGAGGMWNENVQTLPADVKKDPFEIEKSKLVDGYGEFFCRVKVTDTDGLQSVASDPVTVQYDEPVVPDSPPVAPANFQILTQ
jgi:hypothetical protein